MKVGILTQPLTSNYGGILQAYALQSMLLRLGHQVEILNREISYPPLKIIIFRCGSVVKTIYRRYIIGDRRYFIKSPFAVDYDVMRCAPLKLSFINKYICISPNLRSSACLNRYVRRRGINVLVVGSDQVWRKAYSPCISDYFGGFLGSKSSVVRIAYAASFGSNQWEGDEIETEKCKQLAQAFRAISVREDSGVSLCEKHFRMKAIHLLDPTMLLDREDYIELVKQDNTPISLGDLNCYVLDTSDVVTSIIASVADELSLTPFYTNRTAEGIGTRQPSVEEWIRGFLDAKFVVTDSFHACVFSILFQKPFIVWGNKKRGMARFESLLGVFGLQHRLVTTLKDFESRKSELLIPINYQSVTKILNEWRGRSVDFLKTHLYE